MAMDFHEEDRTQAQERCYYHYHYHGQGGTEHCFDIIVDNNSIIALLNLILVKDWAVFESIALSSPSTFRALTAAIAKWPARCSTIQRSFVRSCQDD